MFAQKCNLKEGGISLEKALFLEPSTLSKWPTEYRLKTGDVLVNSTGTGTVGRTRLFHESCLGSYPFVVPDSHVSVIRTFESISSDFIYIVLSSEFGQLYFEDNLSGSTNQKELYIGAISEFLIPLPPENEQRRISKQVHILDKHLEIIDIQKTGVERSVDSVKEKVLDLAIHGKLVPQDPSEEPALDLLQRINPAFTPSHNLHYEGDLPNGWCLTQLKDVAVYGDTSNIDVSSINSDRWILELEDIEKDTARIINIKTKADREVSGVRHSFKKGQILYSKLRTYLNKVLIAPDDGICTTEIVPVTACRAILPDYLLMVMRSPYFLEYSASCGHGVKMPRLGTIDAQKAVVPLPPFAEQARIVEKISELMTVLSSL